MNRVEKREVIFDEKHSPGSAYLLLSGVARITCRNRKGERMLVIMVAPGMIPGFRRRFRGSGISSAARRLPSARLELKIWNHTGTTRGADAQLERTQELERTIGRFIPWLFHHDGKPVKDFRKTCALACERAGVAGMVPHDFRRTAVRNLERVGVPRSAAMAMVGHRSESIYRRRDRRRSDAQAERDKARRAARFRQGRRRLVGQSLKRRRADFTT
jgi:integrase